MGVILKGNSGRKYIFEGPYKSKTSLENAPGVYAVVHDAENKINILELCDSDKIHDSIIKKGKNYFSDYANGYSYAAFYTVNDDLLSGKDIFKDLKGYYNL
jgi:hypothetical protein